MTERPRQRGGDLRQFRLDRAGQGDSIDIGSLFDRHDDVGFLSRAP
jgi:hypothetical protein